MSIVFCYELPSSLISLLSISNSLFCVLIHPQDPFVLILNIIVIQIQYILISFELKQITSFTTLIDLLKFNETIEQVHFYLKELCANLLKLDAVHAIGLGPLHRRHNPEHSPRGNQHLAIAGERTDAVDVPRALLHTDDKQQPQGRVSTRARSPPGLVDAGAHRRERGPRDLPALCVHLLKVGHRREVRDATIHVHALLAIHSLA